MGDGRVYEPSSLPGVDDALSSLRRAVFGGDERDGELSAIEGGGLGSWFEVALLAWAEVYVKPRPVLGDGEVGVGEWERRSLFRVFGDVSEEMRGVPIVRCETGEAVGEFDVVDGVTDCVAWGWDELGGEGWVVV